MSLRYQILDQKMWTVKPLYSKRFKTITTIAFKFFIAIIHQEVLQMWVPICSLFFFFVSKWNHTCCIKIREDYVTCQHKWTHIKKPLTSQDPILRTEPGKLEAFNFSEALAVPLCWTSLALPACTSFIWIKSTREGLFFSRKPNGLGSSRKPCWDDCWLDTLPPSVLQCCMTPWENTIYD